jgi:hypothetical protein
LIFLARGGARIVKGRRQTGLLDYGKELSRALRLHGRVSEKRLTRRSKKSRKKLRQPWRSICWLAGRKISREKRGIETTVRAFLRLSFSSHQRPAQ